MGDVRSGLRGGQWVRLKPKEAILSTLDAQGDLDALPFMPEMFDFCGQPMRVFHRAVKTCDTVNQRGMHEMHDAVFLEGARCSGRAHGGCEARCLLFWKEAWLEPADAPAALTAASAGCTQAQLEAATLQESQAGEGAPFYRCQATQMPRAASRRMPWWDPRQYVRDIRSGAASVPQMAASLVLLLFNKFQSFDRKFLPGKGLIRGSQHWPFLTGSAEASPPVEKLHLQPGDIVRVRSREQIVETLNSERRNRGLSFDGEMAEYCGREFRVLAGVRQILDEKTGRMIRLRDCVILDQVICSGKHYQYCRRSIYPYWRSAWLELVRRAEPEVKARYVTIGG